MIKWMETEEIEMVEREEGREKKREDEQSIYPEYVLLKSQT